MDTQNPADNDDLVTHETPEDVAVLYSWANIQGAKYRDFSASRREFRAQMRKRAAEAARDVELQAKREAEEAAADAEREAREAEEAARFHEEEARKALEEQRQQDSVVEQRARERAIQHARELSRQAAAERMEAARRAEAIAAAEVAAQREAREMAEARASAERQAARYAESESFLKARTGPQPVIPVHGILRDPGYGEKPLAPPERVFNQPTILTEDLRASRLPRAREEKFVVPQPEDSSEIRAENAYWSSLPPDQQGAPGPASKLDIHTGPVNYYYEPDTEEKAAAVDQYAQFVGRSTPPLDRGRVDVEPQPLSKVEAAATAPLAPKMEIRPVVAQVQAVDPVLPKIFPQREGFHPDESSGSIPVADSLHAEPAVGDTALPAWLNSPSLAAPVEPRTRPAPRPVVDTLQQSRERVAARWFALKEIFESGQQDPQTNAPRPRNNDPRIPLTAVFSISGGVGKTSIVATLGRALSASRENVLLIDTTLHGLLPFYFGASELRSGIVRSFSPPVGSNDAPISLVSFDLSDKTGDKAGLEWLGEELNRTGHEMQRVVLDLTPSSPWVARRVVSMNTVVIVPLSPDMNSVISLGAIERFFNGSVDADGKPVLPFYLLNNFDAALPLHLDVREVLRQKLGDRLLPFVIRRAPAVAEALAEGMTVMDYAPESPVAQDYMNLASWLRTQSAPAGSGAPNAQWSER